MTDDMATSGLSSVGGNLRQVPRLAGETAFFSPEVVVMLNADSVRWFSSVQTIWTANEGVKC